MEFDWKQLRNIERRDQLTRDVGHANYELSEAKRMAAIKNVYPISGEIPIMLGPNIPTLESKLAFEKGKLAAHEASMSPSPLHSSDIMICNLNDPLTTAYNKGYRFESTGYFL
jgi:hypothetical protein